MIRIRTEKEANYKAVFVNGKTLRIPLNPALPITELKFPEFYDISPGNKCVTGNCDFCYAAATKSGIHYSNLVEKIDKFFGVMDLNERPFQVAVGGEQEPLENPEFWPMMQRFQELQIVGNYTTNGVLINDKHIENTKKYCGGVAVTLHPHLEKFWRKALNRLNEAKVRVNVHVIISDKDSIDRTAKLYKEFANTEIVEYFVLLPYMNYGHAINNPKKIDSVYLDKWLTGIHQEGKLAFGANFINFLKHHSKKYDVSVYPPEILSKYIRLDDNMFRPDGKVWIQNNSFDKKNILFTPGEGCELGHARSEFIEIQ